MLTLKFCGFAAFLLFFTAAKISAQRVAILTPIETPQSISAKQYFSNSLSKNFKITNGDLAKSVLQSASLENPFNLSTEEAQNFGNAVGCDYFLLLKSENIRRASFTNPAYFESYLAVYVVSSRTGRLIFWSLKNAESENIKEADQKLSGFFDSLVSEITNSALSAHKNEIVEVLPNIPELPDENSPEAKNFRSPLPYKRLRPAYTPLANLYNIVATVDALVDLDENGKITRIDITRWAGYGLDESVIKIINEMQWRPASRDGKTLPIRVLLRYNFKKIERED